MSDPRQQIYETIRSGSWMDTDHLIAQAGKQHEDIQHKMREEAAVVQAALATPDGARFIDWLAKNTLLRPPTDQELNPGNAESYAIAKARREGQNGVLFMILQALQVPQS